MVLAVENRYREKFPADRLFQVLPEGASGKGDFSFLVLGDTGFVKRVVVDHLL